MVGLGIKHCYLRQSRCLRGNLFYIRWFLEGDVCLFIFIGDRWWMIEDWGVLLGGEVWVKEKIGANLIFFYGSLWARSSTCIHNTNKKRRDHQGTLLRSQQYQSTPKHPQGLQSVLTLAHIPISISAKIKTTNLIGIMNQ